MCNYCGKDGLEWVNKRLYDRQTDERHNCPEFERSRQARTKSFDELTPEQRKKFGLDDGPAAAKRPEGAR
jgi:hypothetical protein